MTARRQDDVLRYLVDSESRRGVTHIVELDHYDGNGSCTCEHFTFGLERHLKRGSPPSVRLRCKHIKAARDKLVDDVIERVLAGRKKPKKR